MTMLWVQNFIRIRENLKKCPFGNALLGMSFWECPFGLGVGVKMIIFSKMDLVFAANATKETNKMQWPEYWIHNSGSPRSKRNRNLLNTDVILLG